MTANRPLRIAFIGAGQMAGLHLDALDAVPTAHTVVGVHDLSSSAAVAFAERAGTPAFASPSALLTQARPDIVHVCTPQGTHFEAARQALHAGAHVYVEKPFVETLEEAERLFLLAGERGRLICAGHQLVRDPAFRGLMRRAMTLRPAVLVDSSFAFRPPRLDPDRAAPRALGRQLLDVLPHPLYTLLVALDRLGPPDASIDIAHATATPTELHAVLRMGQITGRLYVSLRGRPVASTLSVSGAKGTLTADFVRAIILGAANEGTSPIEKVANPFVEATQLTWRSATSLGKRLVGGGHYPGLAELLGEFYAAAARGGPSPLSVDHLRRVTGCYEQLAARVHEAVYLATAQPPIAVATASAGPLAVVTGAAGFFGRAINRELVRRGFRVRGVGRSERPDDPHLDEWVRADLGEDIAPSVFAGAAVVVHAAAETAGGFDAHARNTVDATEHVLRAMGTARVGRLVYVSSISVLRPPRWFRERQTEATPLAPHAERLGAYTWGKCAAEQLVSAAGTEQAVRIIRPAALIDWQHIEFPGLLGRRLFGRWHLGLGRPGLPLAVCEVGRAAAAVAWCAAHFDDAPPVVNLADPSIGSRGRLVELFRARHWRGRIIWVPISLLAAAVRVATSLAALVRGAAARPLAVWSILRPRHYDLAVARAVLAASDRGASPAVVSSRAPHAERMSGTYA